MSMNIENVAYYTRKIETYKNRIKWLHKTITQIREKIAIYEECRGDFMKNTIFDKRKKLIKKFCDSANNKTSTNADNSALNEEEKPKND